MNRKCAHAPALKKKYLDAATATLRSLTSAPYFSKDDDKASLLVYAARNYHADPNHALTNTSLIWGDYYLLEALLQYQAIKTEVIPDISPWGRSCCCLRLPLWRMRPSCLARTVKSPLPTPRLGGLKRRNSRNACSRSSRENPRSLYYAQLEARLGKTAVENVTTEEQRRRNQGN